MMGDFRIFIASIQKTHILKKKSYLFLVRTFSAESNEQPMKTASIKREMHWFK